VREGILRRRFAQINADQELGFIGLRGSAAHLFYPRLSAKISGEVFPEAYMSGFTRDVVSTASAPKAIGPYSQAIKANGFVFISGQIPIDPATGNLIEGGIEAQTEQVLKNLSAVLQAAGSSWEKVVKTTVFLKNMSEFGQMNEVYGKTCKTAPPARSTVEVARLPKDVAVEIDVIALA
jgi:2-iminobutanoate/2-iminopropanoate deaminase